MNAFETFLRENISYADLADYLSADFGHDLAIWRDGSVEIIASNAVFPNDDAPVARAQAPGVNNIDGSLFMYPDDTDLASAIHVRCQNSDVSGFMDHLINELSNK